MFNPNITVGMTRKNVKAIMQEKRMTQVEVADNAMMSVRQLQYFISGERDTAFTKVISIAHALGYTLTGLIQYKQRGA